MRILALDVGTSVVKAAILDVATAEPVSPLIQVGLDLVRPTPEAMEVAADRLWSAVTAAARQAMCGVEIVDGIGLSCIAPVLLLLDARDSPLGPIRMPLDRRARTSARHVWAALGDEFLDTAGCRPLPAISAVCYRQQLLDEPYLVRNATSFLHLNGWLAFRMTGARAFDPANASLSGLYNTLTDRQWSEKWCDYFQVEPSWLPPVVGGDTTVGTLRPEVAVEFGVPPGVPVKLGTSDLCSAMLAAQAGPGDLLHIVGPTQVLATLA